MGILAAEYASRNFLLLVPFLEAIGVLRRAVNRVCSRVVDMERGMECVGGPVPTYAR